MSPENHRICKAIEKLLINEFDEVMEADEVKDLQWCIHVSVELYTFLSTHAQNEYPSSENNDTRYCVDSIRSAIDSIFSIHSVHHVLQNSVPRRLVGTTVQTFASFRTEYIQIFQRLQETGIPSHERLGFLVDLGKMQICFVGLTL